MNIFTYLHTKKDKIIEKNVLTRFKTMINVSNYEYKYKCFPAYGKLLMNLRRAGKIPFQVVMVVFSWEIAKAYPRIVISDGTPIEKLEFRYLAGLPVQIVYHYKDNHKVDSLVQVILKVNPTFLSTFGLDLLSTGKARTLIKPLEEIQLQEVV